MPSLRFALAPVLLWLCLMLGGASAEGFFVNMLLQAIALPIIAVALLNRTPTPVPVPGHQLFALVLLMLAVIVAQLVPLPTAIWTGLPGREGVAEGFAALGLPLPSLSWSLTPYRTISSALWLLAPIALLLAILRLRAFSPAALAWALAGGTALSVVIGALQLTPIGDAMYFYRNTNFGASTGFFANANHFGTLLVCTLPFLAALYLLARGRRGGSTQRNSGLIVLLFSAVAVVLVGIVINGSLAAIGLALPVAAASAVMILGRGRRRSPRWLIALVPILLAASVTAVLLGPFGNNLTDSQARDDSRFTSFGTTLHAAGEYFPVGSGIGSFQAVYRANEDPAKVTRWFMNHAHNDYIEVFLETGLPGMAVLALFLFWWGRRAWILWSSGAGDPFGRAGSIASGAILAHSFVDYPLRTVAIAAVFAMSVALMAEPRAANAAQTEERRDKRPRARHIEAD